jgi:Uncharacterized protein conserved in bacteria (DUF2188)
MANYDVMPHPRGGWQVRRDGATRASSRHATLAEAHAVATRHAYRSGGIVRVEDAPGPAAADKPAPRSQIDPSGPEPAELPRAPTAMTGAAAVRSCTDRSGDEPRRTRWTRVAVGLVLLGALLTGAARRGERGPR